MIILSKRVGQVSSNQPLGDENNGPQDSRLIYTLYIKSPFFKCLSHVMVELTSLFLPVSFH